MILPFICELCRVGDHRLCNGGTWCNCQHKTKKVDHAARTQ